ncbi:MAG TPA: hypothetical protein VGH27_20455 [Streptosporangiaceae bacterium]
MLNSSLAGVSCPATNYCMAVGSFDAAGLAATYSTFGEQWNGTSWTLTPTVTPPDLGGGALLNSVSCTSTTSCMAVGDIMDFHALSGGYFTYKPLAEKWNGVVWKVVPTAKLLNTGAVLNGISCFLASQCVAVGSKGTPRNDTQETLAESWNGTKWSSVPTPARQGSGGTALNQVSCATADACQAVGYDGYNSATGTSAPLGETWNGVLWGKVKTPDPGSSGTLTGVNCTAATACTAVGDQGTGSTQTGLAERWNGVVWKVQRLPSPSGSSASSLTEVSCSGPSACMATGSSVNQSSQEPTPLTVKWNGSHWADVNVPDPGAAGELLSVSCATLPVCISVGDETELGIEQPLAEGWDGLIWSVLKIVLPLAS